MNEGRTLPDEDGTLPDTGGTVSRDRGSVLLGCTYFGPIQYFTKFLIYPERVIEIHDNYSKQTYRNRCNIYGANGILTLSIPVLKGPLHKTKVRDIRIDYSRNWRKLHWKGIESAYRHSPFFEFFQDDIQDFFTVKHEFLLDLNLAVLDYLLDVMEIDGGYGRTDTYIEPDPEMPDFRESIHPKKTWTEDDSFRQKEYAQVFSDRHGFRENLSVMDLLFNEGPNARQVLESCVPEVERLSRNGSQGWPPPGG
jgi:hypothetical protein